MLRERLMAFIMLIMFFLAAAIIGTVRPPKPLPVIQKASAGEIAPDPKFKRMLVTAYCPCEKCCNQYADGKTSKGRDAWKTFGVAADPEVLPYGTKLRIPGIGIREVDDTGGAMRQSTKKGICHIDVRFHNHQEALIFGRQWLLVEVLN